MKSYKKKILVKPQFKFQNLLNRLIKEPINYDEFLDLLQKIDDNFFDDPQLEFELLLSNGLPLDIHDDKVYLATFNRKIEDEVFCVVDIETNGSSPKKGYQIIEIGAVKLKNGIIIDKFESLVFARDIPMYVQEVTKINLSMLKDAPVIQKVLQNFKTFLGDCTFVAHDIKFDYNFISDSMEKYHLGKLLNRKICTIDLAKRTIISNKYGLSSLKEVLNIDVDNHHRAYYDALTTAIILKESLQNLDEKVISVEDLISFSKSDNILKTE